MKYISVIMIFFASCSLIGMEETEEGSGRWEFTHWSSEYQEVTHEVNGAAKKFFDETNEKLDLFYTAGQIREYLLESLGKEEVTKIKFLFGKQFVTKCIEKKVDGEDLGALLDFSIESRNAFDETDQSDSNNNNDDFFDQVYEKFLAQNTQQVEGSENDKYI